MLEKSIKVKVVNALGRRHDEMMKGIQQKHYDEKSLFEAVAKDTARDRGPFELSLDELEEEEIIHLRGPRVGITGQNGWNHFPREIKLTAKGRKELHKTI
jgi:hypothetical protein